ncbi:MAG: cupredoxin domain-containing protein [Actinomycetota bacterium]
MRGVLVLAILTSLIGTGCGTEEASEPGSAPPLSSDAVQVIADDLSFDPASLEFQPGETVQLALVNNDTTEHSLTSEASDIAFDIEAEPGASAEAEFVLPEDSRAYSFICRYHPDTMQLELVIGDGVDAPTDEGGDDTNEGSEENDDGY